MDSINISFSGRIKFACKSRINPHREHKVAVLSGAATARALRAQGYANAARGLPRYVPNRTTSSNFHFVPGYFIYIGHKACARAAIAFIAQAARAAGTIRHRLLMYLHRNTTHVATSISVSLVLVVSFSH